MYGWATAPLILVAMSANSLGSISGLVTPVKAETTWTESPKMISE